MFLCLPYATGGKNCSLAKTARGSTNSYVAFVPDESFLWRGEGTRREDTRGQVATMDEEYRRNDDRRGGHDDGGGGYRRLAATGRTRRRISPTHHPDECDDVDDDDDDDDDNDDDDGNGNGHRAIAEAGGSA